MEGMDMIQFLSPRECKDAENCNSSHSPGSNPFDLLWTLAQNDTHPNPAQQIGDSSFKIFDMSFSRADVDNFFSDSLNRESILFGEVRESLGILKIEMLDTTDDIYLKTENSTTNTTSLLNTAFLFPRSYCEKSSFISNKSLSPNLIDFNSDSLEASEPSKIYSISSSQYSRNSDLLSKTEDVLNKAFINSVLHQNKYRMFSLPDAIGPEGKPTEGLLIKSQSCEDVKLSELKEAQVCGKSASLIDEDENFNDSVFIEANHFASKLADGSLLETECFEDNLLDCTTPPEFYEEAEACQSEVKVTDIFKCIDKLVPSSDSQKSPLLSSRLDSLQSPKSINKPSVKDFPKDHSSLELKQSLSKIFKRKSSSSSGSSKDANELLHNLSAIINNENRDMQQNLEGQKLLFGLADILCFNRSRYPTDGFNDSGHSSIEIDEQHAVSDHQCYEVLDLRVGSKSTESESVLDMSIKAKNHSNSFTNPSSRTNKLSTLNNKKKSHTTSITSTLDNKLNSLSTLKLKTKRIDETSVLQKGPLKAVLPVGNMAKTANYGRKLASVSVTPPKSENAKSILFKSTRTSTPILEHKLQPVAQSTPDGSNSELDKSKSSNNTPRSLIKPKSYSPISAQVHKKNSIGEKSSANTQANKLSPAGNKASGLSGTSVLTRRHSASELNSNKPSVGLKRSYSIGKGSKISVPITERLKYSTTAAKQMVLKNPEGTIIQKSSVLQEKNRGFISNLKPLNLLNKLKRNKVDKENAGGS